MQKLSIPIASRNWPTKCPSNGWWFPVSSLSEKILFEVEMMEYFREDEMPKSIRLDIFIGNIKNVEMFIKDQQLDCIKLGHWDGSKDPYWISQRMICYVILNPTSAQKEILTCLILKYGSFENALVEYLVDKI